MKTFLRMVRAFLATPAPAPDPVVGADFTSPEAIRYHQSNQPGRN